MLIIAGANIIIMVVMAAVATTGPITSGIITQNTLGSGATIGKNILALNQILT
jgi:hypothetical protein